MAGAHVVYLVWPPMGLKPLERFAASYREHRSGLEHRLVVAIKGDAPPAIGSWSEALVSEFDAVELRLPAVGRDLDTYRSVAERLTAAELLLLNTASEILGGRWLATLHGALEQPDVGLVGCTGSYESALTSAPRPLRPLLHRRYAPFPNPHVRTNAFMLSRELMLQLDWPAARRKRGALELESGARSVTRQVWERGLRTLVVGRDGRSYEPREWESSLTFRSSNQENLLIADNRTRQYDAADPALRARLAQYAWGTGASVKQPQPVPAPQA